MATVMSPPEQRIVLDDIPWELYEGILEAHRDRSVPRFTYDEGTLEIMSPSPEHEELKHNIVLLVEVLAEEMNINVRGFGSTTFRRKDVKGGFEPDGCFYIGSLARIKGKTKLDLAADPPPDLVIEIDITNSSIKKFPIFARLGVPEVWRCDENRVRIFRLEGAGYVEQTHSTELPGLSAEMISLFLDKSRTLERLTWLRLVRERTRTEVARDGSAN